MTAPRVAVVGGGLAGLASALACADAGLRVTLFEARPRLGGATWSARHQDLDVDNGQHVFLRCCTAYLDFLRRLSAEDRIEIQPRLSIPVLAPGGRVAWLRRSRLPAPLHLAGALLRFSHLPVRDRLQALRVAARAAALDPADPALDAQALGDWLTRQGTSARSLRCLWDLLIRATLNCPAEEASLALAARVLCTGFFERAAGADLGVARVPLAELHAEPARRALAGAGAELHLRAPVEKIQLAPDGGAVLWSRGAALGAEAVVLAVDHEAAAQLLPPEAGVDREAVAALGRSPIVNLHLWLDRRVTEYPVCAAVDSPLQWIFDRSRAAGAGRGQYLAISLSAAEEWVGRGAAELERRFLPALAELLPRARGAKLLRCFVTCERAATFRQVPGSRRGRPGPVTRHPGFFLAGAWTDTGWPATMEGAVRSGQSAARALLAALPGRRRPAPGSPELEADLERALARRTA